MNRLHAAGVQTYFLSFPPSTSSFLRRCTSWTRTQHLSRLLIRSFRHTANHSSVDDTVIIMGAGSVRLIGVDTPETVHPNKSVEAFGKEESAFLTTPSSATPLRDSFSGGSAHAMFRR
jgi:endonuclease YncB( thermonuclease family)